MVKRVKIKVFLTLALCLVTGLSLRAQSGNVGYINSIQASGGFGLTSYYGDLCDNWDCMTFRYNLSGAFIYRASNRIMGRAEINLFKVAGEDEGGKNWKRNLNFKSNGIALEAVVLYDLITYERRYGHRDDFHPYVFGGFGVTRFEPKGELNDKWYRLQPLQTEGRKYNRTSLTLPYGVGVRYMYDKKTNIIFEIGYRMMFTDYLDDVSREYVDNTSFNDPIAAGLADKTSEVSPTTYDSNDGVHWNEGHKRGNPVAGDGYFHFGLKIEYKIKYTKQHHFKMFKRPKFSR